MKDSCGVAARQPVKDTMRTAAPALCPCAASDAASDAAAPEQRACARPAVEAALATVNASALPTKNSGKAAARLAFCARSKRERGRERGVRHPGPGAACRVAPLERTLSAYEQGSTEAVAVAESVAACDGDTDADVVCVDDCEAVAAIELVRLWLGVGEEDEVPRCD